MMGFGLWNGTYYTTKEHGEPGMVRCGPCYMVTTNANAYSTT